MLGANLKTLRKNKGFSQEQLATRLNVVRQTVSKWEQGLSVPDSEMLVKISEVLGASVGELLSVEIAPEKAPALEAVARELEKLNEQLAGGAYADVLISASKGKRGGRRFSEKQPQRRRFFCWCCSWPLFSPMERAVLQVWAKPV